MDQYIGSPKLATYLHPGPSGPFLELNNEPVKPPSPSTSALLQHNPSLIDLCTFNSLCQRLVENSSTSNTSPYKPFVNPSDLYFCIPPMTQIDYSPPANDSNTKSNIISDSTTSPISSAGDCSPNVSSYTSTPYSSPKVKNLLQQNSPLDLCVTKDISTTTIIHQNSSENISNYELSDFLNKAEKSSTDYINSQCDNKNVKQVITKHSHTSPILHRLLTSPTKPNEISSVSNQNDYVDNVNNKSPQYQPRYSPFYVPDTKITPRDYLNKNRKNFRQSCRSPVFTRRPPEQDQTTIESDSNSHKSPFDSSIQPTALLSLDTNGIFNINETHTNNSLSSSSSPTTTTNNNKRFLESFSSEQVLVKRRQKASIPTIIIQQHYCISYPNNISRCIDCQIANPSDASIHLTGCRFQHCRTLKDFGDDTYEVEGFTTSTETKIQDTESLCTSNSSGQPPLNFSDANFIFKQIAKLFCLMFNHEQSEQSTYNEKNIIRKKYMAGWREVCDECLTTLFNYHYMCKQCGYMICIECSKQFSQLTIEKRKKLKRFCPHNDSFCLSEFIPWDILVKLRSNIIDYLSKLKIDYSIKLYHSSKAENLSTFIKSLKMKRSHDARDIQKNWSPIDCNNDPNIEFYCNGRLPVFNEWASENAKQFFQKVWSTSCPILVRQVHHKLSKTLWLPEAFKEHMIDHRETPALYDCETLAPILTNEEILTRFWDGFERLNVRLRDDAHGGRPRILKLKDWPTKKDFASVFPTLLHDLMNNIPFSDYTKRSYTHDNVIYHGGSMNIVERLPPCLVKPDLGPKLYIAYSQLTSQATKKAGTTNLHIDVSDAVNVLVYVGIGGHGDDGSDKEEEIRQVETEILDSNIDEAQLQRLRNGERPGALWHLFRSDDAKKIREYVGRSQRKAAGSDSIHDQTAYLEKEDLERLRDWSKVESYPILQFLGDAVFIPSGAPHQVKNLHSCIKIAEDFVSPENLDRCLITTNEFRSLSNTHTNHADILQMTQHNHHLKRLQHSTNSFDYRSPLPNDEAMRESMQNFSISSNNHTKHSRLFEPGPQQARRGGSSGRAYNRNFHSSISLPTRAINYDLAESFMDHSTNPLSSDLYKIRFKHSAKQWPNGRFINYKENLDKLDGNIIAITCTQNFSTVPKRKKKQETEQNEETTTNIKSSGILVDRMAQEQKKKLADQQTNFYANLFGSGKISRVNMMF
ncbi:unnamed protein product [Rotaria sp. Silwood2]|nr:unnamed protein product [Rotaria sp. Silwood2]